jgi:DNA-directed RNA polymerase subunit RPC12/RpoP
MAGIEAGEWVSCPSCGTKVLGKAMIPVLAEGGGVRYLCVACARAFIVGSGDTTAQTGDGEQAGDGTDGQAPPSDSPDGLVAASGLPLAADGGAEPA